MLSTKSRSDINDYRNDNVIFNVLDSLEPTVKTTGNYGWIREHDLIGRFSFDNQQGGQVNTYK